MGEFEEVGVHSSAKSSATSGKGLEQYIPRAHIFK